MGDIRIEESIQIIRIKAFTDFEMLEAINDNDKVKAVIIDVRQFQEAKTLADIEKKAIRSTLQKIDCIAVLICRLEDAFFSVDCKPDVDMMYLTVSGDVEAHPTVASSVNGILEGEDLTAVEERLHELTDGRELGHLKEIKQLFLKLRNQKEYTRQELKMEESCLFCKLACKKEGLEDESEL